MVAVSEALTALSRHSTMNPLARSCRISRKVMLERPRLSKYDVCSTSVARAKTTAGKM